MTVSKFISFDHQPPWRTVAAMGHGVWRSNSRGRQRTRAQRAGRLAAMAHNG
jgi:hypothetical protein